MNAEGKTIAEARRTQLLRISVSEAAAWVLRVYDGLANDENDGEFALWSENDLHEAMRLLRLKLADEARRDGR